MKHTIRHCEERSLRRSNPLVKQEIASGRGFDTPRRTWGYSTTGPRNDVKLFVLLILLITSCTPSVPTTESGPTPTAVIAGTVAIEPAADTGPKVKPTIAPFRFVLPTPGAEPVSGWRPPLYPVPWAVSAYDHFYFARPIAADNVN